LEAMALSVPIVATNVGAIPSMLSGGCGIVIDPRSDEAIKNALSDLLTDHEKAEAMAKKAYLKVCGEFDCPMVINKYFSVWEKAVPKDN
ncbi:MAG: glycosyltransferase family 4 protein, partial [Clostridia bacterium]|nr:glycosyltransferase family 4 protein [Clostridia bacterium]